MVLTCSFMGQTSTAETASPSPSTHGWPSSWQRSDHYSWLKALTMVLINIKDSGQFLFKPMPALEVDSGY